MLVYGDKKANRDIASDTEARKWSKALTFPDVKVAMNRLVGPLPVG